MFGYGVNVITFHVYFGVFLQKLNSYRSTRAGSEVGFNSTGRGCTGRCSKRPCSLSSGLRRNVGSGPRTGDDETSPLKVKTTRSSSKSVSVVDLQHLRL